MPYIEKHRRLVFDDAIDVLAMNAVKPGEWNYCISRFLHRVIEELGERHALTPAGKPNYAMLNAMIGVLGCAQMELYRMVAAPYENCKHAQNGPVSTLDS